GDRVPEELASPVRVARHVGILPARPSHHEVVAVAGRVPEAALRASLVELGVEFGDLQEPPAPHERALVAAIRKEREARRQALLTGVTRLALEHDEGRVAVEELASSGEHGELVALDVDLDRGNPPPLVSKDVVE